MIEYKAGRKMVIGICDDDKKWRESCKRTLIGFSTMIVIWAWRSCVFQRQKNS